MIDPPVQVHEQELIFTNQVSVGRGGQAADIRPVMQPGDGQFLYKRYQDATMKTLGGDILSTLVSWRRSNPQKAYLDAKCAWPISTVHDDRGIRGILIRVASDNMKVVHLRFGIEGVSFRHADHLFLRPARCAHRGLEYIDPPHKLAILGSLIGTMVWLHDHGFAVGDLHLRNVLFCLEPGPSTLLIDCDACVPLSGIYAGRSPLPPGEPESWWLPTGPTGNFNRDSDYYKIALAVIRCLQEDIDATEADYRILGKVMRPEDIHLFDTCLRLVAGPETHALLTNVATLWQRLVRNGRGQVLTASGLIRWQVGLSAADSTRH